MFNKEITLICLSSRRGKMASEVQLRMNMDGYYLHVSKILLLTQ